MRDEEKRRAWKFAKYHAVEKFDPAYKKRAKKRGHDWWLKNGAMVAERRKADRLANPEKYREREQRYRETHRAKNRASQKKYYYRDIEKSRKKARAATRKHLLSCLASRSIAYARIRAKKTGMACDLTKDWARNRWTGKCELTGLPFVLGEGKPNAFSPSVDRINPILGYTQDNCRFVLWAINRFKGDDTDETMMRIARALARRMTGDEVSGEP